MLSYREFEQQVYDWFKAKHEQDPAFTFSVRVKGIKAARLDYFIGTEKSKYFGTTFWTIHVWYPGSSTDLIDLMFTIEENSYDYHFQFYQPRHIKEIQNKTALKLIQNLKNPLNQNFEGRVHFNNPDNKMEKIEVSSIGNGYDDVDELLSDVAIDIDLLIPLVDAQIVKCKEDYSDFVAHRITADEFDLKMDKLVRRQEKYKVTEPDELLMKSHSSTIEDEDDLENIPEDVFKKNQILFGPPGTGKTYRTIHEAVSIANPSFNLSQDRKDVKKEYNRLVATGQIVFTTFHQNMSYEDFIEGIKPDEPNEGDEYLKYSVRSGIFKRLCARATKPEIAKSKIDWDSPAYYKMSLGGKKKLAIHDWCLENNRVALGWGGDEDLSKLMKHNTWESYRDEYERIFPELVEESRYNITASYIFQKMKKGDIVVVSKGNQIIDAIGIIEGEYYWNDETPTGYYHFREVNWVVKNMDADPSAFIRKKVSQQSIYGFYPEDIKSEAFKELTAIDLENSIRNFVLIIDEINRGNVSQIFGELITLIEEDKRLGQTEELRVTLPYSQEKFSVPSNLYIIGTMNTADRSVEALDAALRRRFSFTEVPPDYELDELDYEAFGVKIPELLELINLRIEKLLDNDHVIGHSYFIFRDGLSEEELVINAFYDKIIPLLKEYFFGDYGKIGLVLGKGFVRQKKENKSDRIFADFNYTNSGDFNSKEIFEILDYRIDSEEGSFADALNTLMNVAAA